MLRLGGYYSALQSQQGLGGAGKVVLLGACNCRGGEGGEEKSCMNIGAATGTRAVKVAPQLEEKALC